MMDSLESSPSEFYIPEAASRVDQNYEKLLEHEVMCKLEECKEALTARGNSLWQAFPILHLVVRKFVKFSMRTCEFCWNLTINELGALTNRLVHCDVMELTHDEKMLERNSTKMLCFLVVKLAEAFEDEMLKKRSANDLTIVWSEERLKLMNLLIRLFNIHLVQLWDPPTAAMMEDISALVVSASYKFLENPTISRDKVVLDRISELLGVVANKYGLTSSISFKLIQLLQNFEHSVGAISNIVVNIATKHSCKQLAVDMFRDIASMDPSDLSMDSSGTKSYASFLTTVSGEIPTAILPAVPVLVPHLSDESTTFRNGVLGVLGQLLSVESGAVSADTRDQMLLRLIDHIYDVNAFVRVKVLHILLQICSVQAIPLPYLQGILERVTRRLKDKSALVRKASLQLLAAMLSSNPFSAKLDKNEFKSRLSEVVRVAEKESDEADKNDAQVAVSQYLQAAIDFTTVMSDAIPLAVDMLGSKVASDVLESLEFLCCASVFQLEGASQAISKCLPLVWSQDERFRKAVLAAYVRLYLTNHSHKNVEGHCKDIVLTLLDIISNCTSGELASLEKVVEMMVSSGHIPDLAIKQVWHMYRQGSEKESTLPCQLLSMIISTSNKFSSLNLEYLVATGLSQPKDLLLAKHTFSAINKLCQGKEVVRLSSDHSLCNQVLHVLTRNFTSLETGQWIPLCQQGLDVVYQLFEQPNMFSETLLRNLSQMLPNFNDGVDSAILSRLLFCVGHVAQCQLVHCELNIVKERKKFRNFDQPASKSEMEEELGMGGGDDQEVELIHGVMETEVGGAGGMLAVFEPMMVCIVSNPSKFSCEQLQTASALSLAKYMLISSTLCDKYLQLFFTLLEKSEFPTVRANLMIAASDLVCRFPNVIEPWTPFLYSRLKDEHDLVRKNAVMVLTHLILNDMIKIRGRISAMALCLEDTNTSIVALAKAFFSELSQKGNNLYNVLPDIISQLTDPNVGLCMYNSFKSIVRYLFHLIKKEKHHESLMEKLCHRLRAARCEEQAHGLAYCLSLFVPTEKGLYKLSENFSCYQERLHDDVIFKFLQAYISKVKKIGKPEAKVHGEELEKRMYAVVQVAEITTVDDDGSPKLSECSPKNFHELHNFKTDALTEARKELTY